MAGGGTRSAPTWPAWARAATTRPAPSASCRPFDPPRAGGKGQVWNTRKDIGITGSGRRVGNFVGNLWVGTEQRGLFWGADSDRGWEPHARVPAHGCEESGRRTVKGRKQVLNHQPLLVVNNLIGAAEGKAAFKLTSRARCASATTPRPSSTFAGLPHELGLRLRQLLRRQVQGNWDTKQDFFTVLSPPFSDPKRWPEYYAHCKDMAHKLMYEGSASMAGHESPGARQSRPTTATSAPRLLHRQPDRPARATAGSPSRTPTPTARCCGDWLGSGRRRVALEELPRLHDLADGPAGQGGRLPALLLRHLLRREAVHATWPPASATGCPTAASSPRPATRTCASGTSACLAMMQENGLYPGGVSGHATHGFSLKMLPFVDCILDSEYPMPDSIDVYHQRRHDRALLPAHLRRQHAAPRQLHEPDLADDARRRRRRLPGRSWPTRSSSSGA